MKMHGIYKGIIVFILVTTSFGFSSAAPNKIARSERPAKQIDLVQTLERMNRVLKNLEQQVMDESKDDASLQIVVELEQLVMATSDACQNRKVALNEFQKMISDMIPVLAHLESAIIEDDARRTDEAIDIFHDLHRKACIELKESAER